MKVVIDERTLGCEDIRIVSMNFVMPIITNCCSHVIVLVNEIIHAAISCKVPVPCLNIVLLIALATSAVTSGTKQVRIQFHLLLYLTSSFPSPFDKFRSAQLRKFENTAEQSMSADLSEFDVSVKASLKKLAKKDQEIQSILRDAQGQNSTALFASNVRNAVMACVSSDETVFGKIRM